MQTLPTISILNPADYNHYKSFFADCIEYSIDANLRRFNPPSNYEKDIFYGMKPTDNDVAKTNDKGVDLNNPMMPIAWTKSYKLVDGKTGKVVTSTIGAANDLLMEGTRRLLVNGVYWAMELPVPAKADVSLVGDYNPTTFQFRKDEYWEQKQLKVIDLK